MLLKNYSYFCSMFTTNNAKVEVVKLLREVPFIAIITAINKNELIHIQTKNSQVIYQFEPVIGEDSLQYEFIGTAC
jgi:hypothetical protein